MPVTPPRPYLPKHAAPPPVKGGHRLATELAATREQLARVRAALDGIRAEYWGPPTAIEDRLAVQELGRLIQELGGKVEALSAELKACGGKDPVERLGFAILPGVDANLPGLLGVRLEAGVQRNIDRETGRANWGIVGGAMLEVPNGKVGFLRGMDKQGIVAHGSPLPYFDAGYSATSGGVVAGVHLPGLGSVAVSQSGHVESTFETPFFGPEVTVWVDHPQLHHRARHQSEQVRSVTRNAAGRLRNLLTKPEPKPASRKDVVSGGGRPGSTDDFET